MSKKILIAKINSVFGIKGEVKIVVYSQDPLQIEKYQIFDEKGNPVQIKITNKNKTIVGHSGSGDPILIAKLSTISNRNEAEAARGAEFFVNREDLQDTADDEFYYADLIGLEVRDANTGIGKVVNVQDFGAGGMLEIEFEDSFRKTTNGKNFEKIENFPFSGKIFSEVNLSQNFIKIELPEILKE